MLQSIFGVTDYFRCYIVLLVLQSTFGVIEYLWCYRVPFVLQSTFRVTEYLPLIVLIGPILRFILFKVTILLTKTTNLLLLFMCLETDYPGTYVSGTYSLYDQSLTYETRSALPRTCP